MTDPGLDPTARTGSRDRRRRRTRSGQADGTRDAVRGRRRSSRSSRVRPRSGWELVLGVLVLLAIVASVIMVFTDSVPLLRIGLVAALWAAVVGAIAMTKFRKDSESDAARARDLKMVYELQLEREISARREYELVVENQVRGQVEQQVRSESAEHMQALMDEVASLRASLEVLFDGELPDERVAVQAQSHRIHELAGAPRRRVAEQAAELPEIDDVVAVTPEAADVGEDDDFEPDYEAYREAAQFLPGAGGDEEGGGEEGGGEEGWVAAEGVSAEDVGTEDVETEDVAPGRVEGEDVRAEDVQAGPMEAEAVDAGDDLPEDIEPDTTPAERAAPEDVEAVPFEDADDFPIEDAEEFPEAVDADETGEAGADGAAPQVAETDEAAVSDEAAMSDEAVETDEVVGADGPADDSGAEDADDAGSVEDAESEADAESEGDDAPSEHGTRAGGNTVAELLERMRESGTVPENLGRRRRRAED